MEKFINFLAGFRLASVLLILLLLLTFFGTIEQVDHGLYATINKYFTWQNVIVLPDLTINGKLVPIPLPGAYWVCVALFFNMFLGGVLKIRKSWKNSFVVISHFGILFLLVGGFVTHHYSSRGNMALYEGEASDYAQHYHDHSIEVSLLDEKGVATKIYEFDDSITSKIPKGRESSLKLVHKELPFTLSANNALHNCRPIQAGIMSVGNSPVVDGYSLREVATEQADEANFRGYYVEASTGDKMLLFSGAFAPYVIEHEGSRYAVSLRKSIWKMPFQIHLDDFNAEFFPTGKPKRFESYITRLENGISNKVKIYMNHPMRYQGFTFFQASWGPPDGGKDDRLYTVFEVVENPADQWPTYSIYITTLGLLLHFGWSLLRFILQQTKKKVKS